MRLCRCLNRRFCCVGACPQGTLLVGNSRLNFYETETETRPQESNVPQTEHITAVASLLLPKLVPLGLACMLFPSKIGANGKSSSLGCTILPRGVMVHPSRTCRRRSRTTSTSQGTIDVERKREGRAIAPGSTIIRLDRCHGSATQQQYRPAAPLSRSFPGGRLSWGSIKCSGRARRPLPIAAETKKDQRL